MVDDRDAIAHALDLGQQVAVQEDGRAGLGSTSDDRPDVGTARPGRGRTSARRGRPGAAHPAARRPARAAAACPSRSAPTTSSARSARSTTRSTASMSAVDVAAPPSTARSRACSSSTSRAVQPGLVAEQLGQVADLAPRRSIAERRPEHGPAATGRPGQPEQQLHGRGLARAVGPEETEDLARLDAQGQVDQRIGAAVALGQPVGVDDGATRGGHGHAGVYSPEYACRPLNQSDPEYVMRTIPKPTTSSSAAGRPAHERWLRACR